MQVGPVLPGVCTFISGRPVSSRICVALNPRPDARDGASRSVVTGDASDDEIEAADANLQARLPQTRSGRLKVRIGYGLTVW